jgi:hypothetical protein
MPTPQVIVGAGIGILEALELFPALTAECIPAYLQYILSSSFGSVL